MEAAVPIDSLETIAHGLDHPEGICVTPDGTVLLFCEIRPDSGYDILRLPLVAAGAGSAPPERPSEATSLVSTPSAEYAANISPDGRYLAYQSTQSGVGFAIYVRPYPDATQGQWQISTGGGMAPVWARNGRELFYLDESNTLMSVPVQTAGTFSYGRPAKVFETRYSGDFYSYDVTPDGRRFLMMKASTTDDRNHSPNIVVVLNWFEELRRRVPDQYRGRSLGYVSESLCL